MKIVDEFEGKKIDGLCTTGKYIMDDIIELLLRAGELGGVGYGVGDDRCVALW
jgi:hypothetical protein